MPEPVDGFEFGVTVYNGMDKDTIKLPRQFSSTVDNKEEQVLLSMCDGVTGVDRGGPLRPL
jgi:hypothetical protein